MTRTIAFMSLSLLLLGCLQPPARRDPGDDDGDDDPPAAECEVEAPAGKEPGHPFDVTAFRGEVLPVVVGSCGTAGCHAAPTGIGGFTVWADAADDDCNFVETFEQVTRQISLAAPGDSRLLQAPSGGSATHPRVLEATTEGYAALKLFIDDAAALAGGDDDPPAIDDPHDPAVFQTVIQPMLDSTGCTGSGCHANGAGNFKVFPNATGANLDANFVEVTKRNDLDEPAKSRVYVKGTTSHFGSRTFSGGDAKKFFDWVTAAASSAP